MAQEFGQDKSKEIILRDVSALSMHEAVSLLHAQIEFLCESKQIRSLFVKGPAVQSQGLREPRQSTDVDVWIEPSKFNELLGELYSYRWQHRPTDKHASLYSSHSVTLYNPDWPCDIDLHSRIPGMECSPEEAFEVVWESRSKHSVAGKSFPIPSIEASRLILALHSLRSMDSPREPHEYNYLKSLDFGDLNSFKALALSTNSIGALKPFLSDMGIIPEFEKLPEPSAEWLYLSSTKSNAEKRLEVLTKTPLKNKPTVIWTALFPSKQALQVNDLYQDTSPSGIIRAYFKRYGRAFQLIKQRVRS